MIEIGAKMLKKAFLHQNKAKTTPMPVRALFRRSKWPCMAGQKLR
jgi:hypothetical protein